LWHDADSGHVTLELLSLIAQPETFRFALDDAQVPATIHPLATFSVKDRVFYVDEELFEDKELFAKLCSTSDISQKTMSGRAITDTTVTADDESYWAELEAQEAEDELRRKERENRS